MLQPQVLWTQLSSGKALVLQTPLPRASVIALGFLTSQYPQFPYKQLQRTQHCLSILKVIIQILTWAFPGVQALFGPSQQDFCQPPPQSAVGTLLPPYPGGRICLRHSLMCCFTDQPADHTSCHNWVFFSQFHLQMAQSFFLQGLESYFTASGNCGLLRN